MTRFAIAIALAASCAATCAVAQTAGSAASQPAATRPALTSDVEKLSYSIGMDFARNVKRNIPEADFEAAIRGIRDVLAGKALLGDAEADQILRTRNERLAALERERAADPAKANKTEGEEFLARNAKEPGVQVTPSGLQYKVLKEGDGNKPRRNDIVAVKYRGTFVNGTEFDSSRGRASPFRVTGVIPGWTEALQMMPVGSKWMLYIPPHLAYGEKGAPPTIGPNATLIFEVELMAIRDSGPPKLPID